MINSMNGDVDSDPIPLVEAANSDVNVPQSKYNSKRWILREKICLVMIMIMLGIFLGFGLAKIIKATLKENHANGTTAVDSNSTINNLEALPITISIMVWIIRTLISCWVVTVVSFFEAFAYSSMIKGNHMQALQRLVFYAVTDRCIFLVSEISCHWIYGFGYQ